MIADLIYMGSEEKPTENAKIIFSCVGIDKNKMFPAYFKFFDSQIDQKFFRK